MKSSSRKHKSLDVMYRVREQRNQKYEAKNASISIRQAERAKRNSVQQIKVLDSRLGVGIGAKKERKKLEKKS